MSWERFEHDLRGKNTKLFSAEKLTITPAVLIATLRRAYEAGHYDGVTFVKDVQRMSGRAAPSLFDAIFGDK